MTQVTWAYSILNEYSCQHVYGDVGTFLIMYIWLCLTMQPFCWWKCRKERLIVWYCCYNRVQQLHYREVVTYMSPVEAFVTRIKIFAVWRWPWSLDRLSRRALIARLNFDPSRKSFYIGHTSDYPLTILTEMYVHINVEGLSEYRFELPSLWPRLGSGYVTAEYC